MAAPILFGRRMKLVSGNDDQPTWDLKRGDVLFQVCAWYGEFEATLYICGEVVAIKTCRTLPAALGALTAMRNRLVRQLQDKGGR
jgi:hypothetical protein